MSHHNLIHIVVDSIPTADQNWVDVLSALLVPVLACLGLFIAYRQWRTAQNKLKFELFGMRLTIHRASRDFISGILSRGKSSDEEIYKFLNGTSEAKWVLSSELAEYLDKELYAKAIDLQCLSSELEGVPAGEERTDNIKKQREIKNWLTAQHKVIDDKFSTYLTLRH
jgi:hypothetical protein